MARRSLSAGKSFSRNDGIYLFTLVCFYLLVTEELLHPYHLYAGTVLRNLLPIAAILLFLLDSLSEDSPLSGLTKQQHRKDGHSRFFFVFFISGIVFSLTGIAGWAVNHYQTFSITIQTLYEHLRFWLCLYLFFRLFSGFPPERYARRLFIHAAVPAALLLVLTCLDVRWHIWPRQIYRFGIGSIQLFFGHPSNLGARAVFFIAFFCILFPYLRKPDGKLSVLCILNTVLTFLMLGVVLLTLRIRLFGFAVFFVVLFVYILLFRRKVHLPIVLAGTAGAFIIGRKRLYDFYFSPYAYTMARGQFAVNSLDIARQNFPFGSGFGTFGSRLAQVHYSPLYYKYNMMLILGLSPEHSNYACDTFFPVILAESGWIGFAAYLCLIIFLIILVFKGQKLAVFDEISRRAVFVSFILIAYELLETTGTLAFSEGYSVLITLPFGIALSRLFADSRPGTDV